MITDSDLISICLADDFITSDKYLNHTQVCGHCNYSKTDLFWFGGIWRGQRKSSILKENRKNKSVLIFGHSDHPVTRLKLIASKIKGYEVIYGINLNPILSNCYSIPLGLTNDTNESALHSLLGNTAGISVSIKSVRRPINYTNSIYANFTISNNRDERGTIARSLEKTNNFVCAPNLSEDGRIDYLKALRSANFVVCPEGNGVDTHRLWETLYVGGTPIVKSNTSINSLIQDLPVLVINDWEELADTEKMKDSWERIQSQNHQSNLIRSSYWESVFLKSHT